MFTLFLRIFFSISLFYSFASWAESLNKEELAEMKSEYERPKKIPYPASNRYSKEKDELGKQLYFDPRLSGSKWISCATCHNPGLGWEDGLALGTGHGMKKLGRHSPTILNLAWGEIFMWDGRKATLEDQALGPIESTAEMNMDLKDVVKRLKNIKGYEKSFKKVFGKSGVTRENIGKAIATFERGIVSGEAPFDRWIQGDEKAISASAKRGFILFNDKANCVSCHSGWRFTDDSFHDIGLKSKDIGRYEFVKSSVKMKHAFKTPGLRNIDRRAPYMHDGSLNTLKEVVEHYNSGFVKRESLSDEMGSLSLSKKEVKDIVNFLKTLTGPVKAITFPILPAE